MPTYIGITVLRSERRRQNESTVCTGPCPRRLLPTLVALIRSIVSCKVNDLYRGSMQFVNHQVSVRSSNHCHRCPPCRLVPGTGPSIMV